MKSSEELVEFLNIKVIENSPYRSMLKRKKKKIKGFHSGMK